jgi:hypothetical protein
MEDVVSALIVKEDMAECTYYDFPVMFIAPWKACP